MQRLSTTLVAWSLLGLLAAFCCATPARAQDETTHWQVDGGGGSGTRAVMTLEGSRSGLVRLRFVRSPIEVSMHLIPDGAEYFSGQRSGNFVSGLFAHSLLKPSSCAPAYSGELVLSADGRSFTLTAAARTKLEPRFDDKMCERYGDNMPTCRGRNRVEPSCGSAFRPADVTRGVQIHWPSKQVVAAPAPSVIAPMPDAATKPVAIRAPDSRLGLPQAIGFGFAPERIYPMFAVLVVVMVGCLAFFRRSTIVVFAARALVLLVRWLALAVAMTAFILGPLHVLGQHPEWRQVEGSLLHWVHVNITDSIAAALNKSAPHCGTALLLSTAWPRCQASLTTMVAVVGNWFSWGATGQWLSGAWQWLSANSGGVLPWVGWLSGAIWAWVSAPFVWVFSSISGVLWWLATPFVQFFWLVYTIFAWVIWLAVQLVIWVAWLLWHLGVWVLWLLGQALYYAAFGLKWFAINLGNYVIALTAVLAVILSAGLNDNRFGKWMNKRLPIRRMFQAFIDAHGTAAKERRKQEEEARQRTQREARERKRQEHPSGVTSDAFDKAKAAFGIHNTNAELNEDDMRKLYRSLRAKAHPDSVGGSHDQFLKIDAAWMVICTRMYWQQK